MCFGGLLFFFSLSLFGYSLTRSSCFGIANLENLFRYINLSGIPDSRNLKKLILKNGDGWIISAKGGGDIWFDNLDD